MKNPKKERMVTKLGFITRRSFFNYDNQTEMRELTNSEIKKIINYFKPWIDIVKDYFKQRKC